MAERYEDLEGLDEKKEEAQECGHGYRQKMAEAYGKTIRERVFVEGQLVLRTSDYVRRRLAGPFKFSPKWEGPFVVGRLMQADINTWPKWMEKISWTLSMASGSSVIARRKCYVSFLFFFVFLFFIFLFSSK